MEEIWKDIVNFEGIYQVSSIGRCKRLAVPDSFGRMRKERILRQTKDTNGYFRIRINKNTIKTTIKVHRAVAIAFIPNPENKPEVNHKYGIKTDNRATELEWVTTSQNIKHAYDSLGKVTPMKGKFGAKCPNSKKIICINTGIQYNSMTEAAKELKLGISTISFICQGKVSQAYGLKFKYA